MSALVPMITSAMLKYDPISHQIWIAEPLTVAPVEEPDTRRVLAGLAAAAVAARLVLVAALATRPRR